MCVCVFVCARACVCVCVCVCMCLCVWQGFLTPEELDGDNKWQLDDGSKVLSMHPIVLPPDPLVPYVTYHCTLVCECVCL